MDVRRIALLNANTPEYRAVTSQNFRDSISDGTLIEYHASNNEIPQHHDFEGYIVTGSAYSVLDNTDWMQDLKDYLKTTINQDNPVLGICFGHQFLASLLGGTVEYMGEYEIGYFPIRKTTDSPLLADLNDPFYSFITHEDIVTELPEGATQIAETDYGIHGFEYNDQVYGLQSHPEFTYTTATNTLEEKDLSADVEARAKETITRDNAQRAEPSRKIFSNFLETAVSSTTFPQ